MGGKFSAAGVFSRPDCLVTFAGRSQEDKSAFDPNRVFFLTA